MWSSCVGLIRNNSAPPTISSTASMPFAITPITKNRWTIRCFRSVSTDLRMPPNESRSRLNEIPQVAVEVLEDRNGAIGCLLRLPDESYPARSHRVVITPEIVGLEKQEDAAAGLVPDCGDLGQGRCARQEERRAGRTGRRHDHPAFVLLGLI